MRSDPRVRWLAAGTAAALFLTALLVTATATAADATYDDVLPGIDRTLPISLSDSLDPNTDYMDVSRVHLGAGQMLKVSLTGDAGTDLTVALLSSAATNTQDFAHFVAASYQSGTSTETFNYESAAANDYYLETYMHTLVGGGYTLTAKVIAQHVSSLSGPLSAKRWKWFRLSGYITPMHASARNITISAYHKVGSKWKLGAAALKLYTRPVSGKDRSSFTFTFKGQAGKWRFRAAHTSGKSVIYSGWKYVTIK